MVRDDLNMKQPWRVLRKWITFALVALFVVDLGLVYIRWQSSPESVAAMRIQRDQLERQAALLKGDVQRGEKIRNSLNNVQRDYDAFYKTAFLSTADGYSAIESDLAGLASKSGLRTANIGFQQKDVKGRGVTDVSIDQTVEGDYPALVQYINGLEHSKYFYLLSDLKLDTASTGGIRLHLDLHTYFRN